MLHGYFEERERIETVAGTRYDVDSGFVVNESNGSDVVDVYLYGLDDIVEISISSICSQGRFVNDEHFHSCVERAEDARRADPWRR